MKAVLTLPSLTEDVVAEVALWEHLNAAWGGTCWVGVLVGCSHVKATCGSGVEDRGDGSLCVFPFFTSRSRSSLLTELGRLCVLGERHAASQAVCQGVPRNTGGWPAAPLTPEGQPKDIL